MNQFSDLECMIMGGSADQETWVKICLGYREGLCHSFGRKNIPKDQFEDFFHDVVCKVLKSYSSYDRNKGTIAGFLFGIASHVVSDFFREKRRIQDYLEDASYRQKSSKNPPYEEFEEIREIFWSVVDTLPDHYRDVIYLRYFYKYSIQEIADLLGESYKAINLRSFRAREKIKKKIPSYER